MADHVEVQEERKEKSKEKLLYTLESVQGTWLKKEPISADLIEEKDKLFVEKGKTYGVVKSAELPMQGHAKITLASRSGEWWIYEPHWKKKQDDVILYSNQVSWSNFNCLVTENLTVGEILQWDKRRTPSGNSTMRERLCRTALQFQQIRDVWGPLGVTSFYRPEPINSEVGGVPGSRHTMGDAMDVYPIGRGLNEFYIWIRSRWTGGLGDGRDRGFIHLDTRNAGGFVPGGGVRPFTEWLY